MSNYGLSILPIYIVTLISLYIYRYVNKKIGSFIAYAVSFFAFMLAGFRPDYFPDVDTYKLMFEFASTGDFENSSYWLSHGEPGFKIFSWVISQIALDYRFYLLTIELLSFILLIIASRQTRVKFVYVWFFYLSTFFVTRDLGSLRLSIASHLIVIALSHRRVLDSIFILAFCSLSFQYYSFVAALSIFISKYKFNCIRVFIIIIASLAFAPYLKLDLMSGFALEHQLNNYNLANTKSLGWQSIILPTVRNLLFAIIVVVLYKRIKIGKIQKIWIISLYLSVVSYIIFKDFLIIAQRFSAYFGAILPFALAWICDKRNHSMFFKFHLITLFFIINFIILFYYNDFVWLPRF